jgi:hypothetical protein
VIVNANPSARPTQHDYNRYTADQKEAAAAKAATEARALKNLHDSNTGK